MLKSYTVFLDYVLVSLFLPSHTPASDKDFNLGLAPISSTSDAKKLLKLLSEKLKTFNLDLSTDVVTSTNEGD